jgi:hypothetical protein
LKEVQVQGVLAGDAVTVSVSAALATFADRNAGPGKTVTVSGLGLGGTDAGNYRPDTATAQAVASITPKSLALGALTVADKVYDGTTTATVASGSLTGVLAGDAVALDLARLVAEFSDKNAGRDKAVAISGLALTGSEAANYRLGDSSAGARGSIAVRPVSTWTGTASGLWSDPANWDVRPEGANVASVVLPAAAGGAITFDAAAPAVALQELTTSRNLVVAATGLAADRLDNRAALVLAAGVNWDLSRRSVVGSGTFTNRGALTVVDTTLENALFNEGGAVTVGGLSRLGPVTNTGRFTLLPGAVTTVQGAYRQTAGTTTLGAEGAAPPTLAVAAGAGVAIEGGELAGSGTLDGNLVVGSATLAPGFSPGSLAITGNLSLGPGSTTAVEIGGTQAGRFDFLNVAGQASLDGTLRLASHGGFRATGSEQITFLQVGGNLVGGFARFVNEDPLLAALPWSAILVGTPGGLLTARPMATQQVDAMLTTVKPPEPPAPPVPTPPTIAALTPPGSAGGGPGDPLFNIVPKAGNASEPDEERLRQAGDGVGPPAPVAASGPEEPPFVEARPAQVRAGVRSLEFEPAPATTVVKPATREVDRHVSERSSSGC